MNYNWNWKILLEMEPGGTGTYLEYLLVGLLWTLATALAAWVLALAIGALVGTLRTTTLKSAVRAGINSLPRGQRMAGTAMGLTEGQTYRYVILPQCFRIILPPLTSEFMNIVQKSSVA